MSIKSCQYNPDTKVVTVVCSDDFVVTFDYAAYLPANLATRSAMLNAAIAEIQTHGGYGDGKVSIAEVGEQPIFTFIEN